MPTRFNIYAGPALRALLAAHGMADGPVEGDHYSRSGLISAVAERYREVCRRSLPRLSADEWCLIFDALNGYASLIEGDTVGLTVSGVALGVADHIHLNGADTTWDVDGPALVARLAACTWTELLAVLDAAERFWSFPEHPAGTRREMAVSVVGEGAVLP